MMPNAENNSSLAPLGTGLTRSLSHAQRRLEALLLIGHISGIAKRLIGDAAKSMQLQFALVSRKQAKHHQRAEISMLTLAARVIKNPALLRKIGDPLAHIHGLRLQVMAAINPLPCFLDSWGNLSV